MYSPEMVPNQRGPAVAASDPVDDVGGRQTQVAKTLNFSDSPVPPVLHTPGVKQIPHLGDAAQHPQAHVSLSPLGCGYVL